MSSNARSDHLLTIQEAAQQLGVSTRFVRRAVRSRTISYVRVGRLVRFRPEDLDEYLRVNQTPANGSPAAQSATEVE